MGRKRNRNFSPIVGIEPLDNRKPHPVLRALLPPVQTPKHREDRLKAIASALQTIALAVVGVGLITPLFSPPSHLVLGTAALALIVALGIETLSLLFLLYIPYTPTEED
ncbi:hypothetical protein [Acetobacter sp.]|uniref:hypothetical protein n=1 Tax=Acetobacter sp. TaxID=440 RepID=UPI0039EA0C3D